MPDVRRRWTRAEVLDLANQDPLTTTRYELVDGLLFVTPSPTVKHQRAVMELCYVLRVYLNSQPAVGDVLFSPVDVMLEPETTVGPDLFVMPPDEAARTVTAKTVHLLRLAVEVISPSSKRGDQGRKRHLYQRRVPEYWIVDLDLRHFERWRPLHTEPDILREQLEWHPTGATRPFVLDIRRYFAAVYREQPGSKSGGEEEERVRD